MEDIIPILFDVSTYEKVKHDGKELHKRLECISKDVQFEDHGLENYLLIRLMDLWYIEGGELNFLELSRDIKSLELVKAINDGSYKKIHKSRLFRLSSRIKIINVAFNEIFM